MISLIILDVQEIELSIIGNLNFQETGVTHRCY